MKNVGVPDTPLMSADSTSSAIRAERLALADVLAELVDVEAERLGVGYQVLDHQPILVREQRIVHVPEAALGGGRLRRLGRDLRMRVDVVER